MLTKYKDKTIQNDFAAEKKALMDLNAVGLKQGFAAGIGTFILLRFGRRMLANWATRRIQQQQQKPFGSYKFGDSQVDQAGQAGASGFAQSQQKWTPRPEGLGVKIFRTMIEVALSFNSAILATAYWTDTDAIVAKAADIPLVEGRSMVSNELCDDFIREYHSIPSEFWKELHDKHPTSTSKTLFLSIERFVRNCKKRRIYESQLTQSQGNLTDAFGDYKDIDIKFSRPFIPSPGVPRGVDISSYHSKAIRSDDPDDVGQSSFIEDEFADGLNDISSDFSDQVEDWKSMDDFDENSKN